MPVLFCRIHSKYLAKVLQSWMERVNARGCAAICRSPCVAWTRGTAIYEVLVVYQFLFMPRLNSQNSHLILKIRN